MFRHLFFVAEHPFCCFDEGGGTGEGGETKLWLAQKINRQFYKKCSCDLTRGTRVKALRKSAFKVAHLAAGGIAFCMFYFCAGPYGRNTPAVAEASHVEDMFENKSVQDL